MLRGYWDRRLMVLSEHDAGGGGGAGAGAGAGGNGGAAAAAAGNDGGGADDGGEAWDEARARQTIQNLRTQERNLTRERNSLANKVKEYESANQTELEKLQTRMQALEAENTTLKESQRVAALQAQVAEAANAAGAFEPADVFALLDRSALDVDESTGKVKNATALVNSLKQAKPYLFSTRQGVDAGAGRQRGGGSDNGGANNSGGFSDLVRSSFGVNR